MNQNKINELMTFWQGKGANGADIVPGSTREGLDKKVEEVSAQLNARGENVLHVEVFGDDNVGYTALIIWKK